MIQDLIENVKLTPQEQNIVNYIDHHPKEVMTLNAKELSEKIFVSPPTMGSHYYNSIITCFSKMR